MIRAEEDVVRRVLQPHEDLIFKAVHGAWGDWRDLSLGGRLLFPGRTRACLIHDFMVQRVMSAWTGDSSVRVIQKDETAKFIIADQVALRFKKADDRGLGSNIQTQATMEFEGQQFELPGLPDVHKVEVVYLLNRLQTQIDQILVVARDGDKRLWNYTIMPKESADIIPLPTTIIPGPERGARVKVRKLGDDKKKDIGE